MNTLRDKFPWGIWRLGETMPDKPKEWGDCRFLKREVIEQPSPTMHFFLFFVFFITFLYFFLCDFPEERFSNQFWSSVAFAYFILEVHFFYENGKQVSTVFFNY